MWKPEHLVRRHLHAGYFPAAIKKDVRILKRVLADWVQVVEQLPLTEKAAFHAELEVTLCAPPPPPPSPSPTTTTTNTSNRHSNKHLVWTPREMEDPYSLEAVSAVPGGRHSQVLTRRATQPSSSSALTFTRRFPMQIWLSLLPWEIQRGLSKAKLPRESSTSLSSPPIEKKNKMMMKEEESQEEGDEPEDPLGVLFSRRHQANEREATTTTTNNNNNNNNNNNKYIADGLRQGHHAGCGSPPDCRKSTSLDAVIPAVIPGMLFVLDVPGVRSRQGGVHFWSGAIIEPIDVLFFRPGIKSQALLSEGASTHDSSRALAEDENAWSSSSPDAASIALQSRDLRDRLYAREGPLSPAVADTFFPPGDLNFFATPAEMNTTTPGSSTTLAQSLQQLLLHREGHLDPFPHVLADLGQNPEKEEGADSAASRSHEISAFTKGPPYAHYVLECPRHTLESAIASTFRDFTYHHHHPHPHPQSHHNEANDDGDAGVVGLAAPPSTSTASNIAPPPHATASHPGIIGRLWTSQPNVAVRSHVSLHLSAALEQQLLSRARMFVGYVSVLEEAMELHMRRQTRPPSSSSAFRDPGEEEEEGELGHEETNMPPPTAPASAEEEKKEAAAMMRMTTAHHPERGIAPPASLSSSQGANDALVHRSIRNNNADMMTTTTTTTTTTRPSSAMRYPVIRKPDDPVCHVEDLSPMLTDEAEGRPRGLAPSFLHPLHPSADPSQSTSSRSRSAKQASLYPLTHAPPSDPRLLHPPVDYELISQAFRLGVGLDSVLRHYYERLLLDWRKEVLQIRKLRKRRTAREQQEQEQNNNNNDDRNRFLSTLPASIQRLCGVNITTEEDPVPEGSRITDDNVRCLLSLVRDHAIQFPEELGALVEFVAEDRGMNISNG